MDELFDQKLKKIYDKIDHNKSDEPQMSAVEVKTVEGNSIEIDEVIEPDLRSLTSKW